MHVCVYVQFFFFFKYLDEYWIESQTWNNKKKNEYEIM